MSYNNRGKAMEQVEPFPQARALLQALVADAQFSQTAEV